MPTTTAMRAAAMTARVAWTEAAAGLDGTGELETVAGVAGNAEGALLRRGGKLGDRVVRDVGRVNAKEGGNVGLDGALDRLRILVVGLQADVGDADHKLDVTVDVAGFRDLDVAGVGDPVADARHGGALVSILARRDVVLLVDGRVGLVGQLDEAEEGLHTAAKVVDHVVDEALAGGVALVLLRLLVAVVAVVVRRGEHGEDGELVGVRVAGAERAHAGKEADAGGRLLLGGHLNLAGARGAVVGVVVVVVADLALVLDRVPEGDRGKDLGKAAGLAGLVEDAGDGVKVAVVVLFRALGFAAGDEVLELEQAELAAVLHAEEGPERGKLGEAIILARGGGNVAHKLLHARRAVADTAEQTLVDVLEETVLRVVAINLIQRLKGVNHLREAVVRLDLDARQLEEGHRLSKVAAITRAVARGDNLLKLVLQVGAARAAAVVVERRGGRREAGLDVTKNVLERLVAVALHNDLVDLDHAGLAGGRKRVKLGITGVLRVGRDGRGVLAGVIHKLGNRILV